MLTALNRKLVRDLWRMKTQAAAITLVLSCGIAVLVMSVSTLTSLQSTRATYYERSRFADVFAQLKRAPRHLEEQLAEIPGVGTVQTRVVRDVTLDVPGLDEPATGRLISLPDRGEPKLNLVHLRTGRMPEPGRAGEVVAGEAFTQANGLTLGDHIRAVINGRLQQLTIVGVGLSPEYVYQIRPGELMPDDRRFGVFWMSYEALAEAFDMDGAFNDVSIALLPNSGGEDGAVERGVIDRLDALLARYGSGGAYGRADQISHRFLSDEMRQLTAMSILPPTIFLGVSGFLLNTVLSRIIRTQREQIAALKAFGYTNTQIALHYLGFALVISATGCVLGVALGWYLGGGMTAIYTQFFRFPTFAFALDPRAVGLGILLSAGLSLTAVLGSVRQAAALPPAEAMRPEPPPVYRPTIIERLGLQRLFAAPSRMILRKLESHPWRAGVTVLGLALSIAVLIVGRFSLDAIDEMIDMEFHRAQRQDVTVTLVEPTSARAVFEFERMPGVVRSEPFRSVPVRMRAGHYQERLAILGLTPTGSLRRVLDQQSHVVDLPPDGLVLSDKLAEILHVGVGERVRVEALEGERPVIDVPVAAVVAGYLGTSAYMRIDALNRLMREGSSVSGAFLQTDADATRRLYRELKEMPRVAGVNVKSAAIVAFRKTVAENMLRMRAIQATFASIIAFGVVYNAARITLAERARELASMRVLGFTRGEVSVVLLGELGVLLVAAVPVGLVLGRLLAATIVAALETESYTIPLVILPSTYASAVLIVLIASGVSALIVRRGVDKLDMVSVLKAA